MSGKTWVIGDTHFNHANMCKFLNYDGTKVRPYENVEEMNAALINNWNSVVDPGDRVYHLGDACMGRNVEILHRLNGRKVLVKGNHDEGKLSRYAEIFDDVRAYVPKHGFILSHMPIHPDSMGRWRLNIHGHLHNNVISVVDRYGVHTPDLRYYNASVERIGYTPILLQDILKERDIV